jgi:hypothetical protein
MVLILVISMMISRGNLLESLDFGDTKVFFLIDQDPYRLSFPDISLKLCYCKAVFNMSRIMRPP